MLKTLLCLPPIVMIGGCLSMGGAPSLASPRADTDQYQLVERTHRSATGCQYDYRIFQPLTPSTTTSVILGHGFLRDQDNMVGLSRSIANQGIRVITLDFCNMRPWNGHHQRNAMDMHDLAQSLDIIDDIVYAGFSAGALAAVLAADDNTRAIVALDLVDQAELGKKAISKLSTPLIGIAGPPSSCNADNNASALFSDRTNAAPSHLSTLPGATHCDFESPSDWLCELACGKQDTTQMTQQLQDNIVENTLMTLRPYLNTLQSDNILIRDSRS